MQQKSQSSEITFVTANVGSLFPMHSHIHEAWKETMKKFLIACPSKIVVINMQEFGGKKPLLKEDGEKFFQEFRNLTSGIYDSMVAYYDDEVDIEEAYTALSVVILFSSAICLLKYYNWDDKCFHNYSKGLAVRAFKDAKSEIIKEKFPLDHFPDQKLSRKGFCLSRLQIGKSRAFDAINLHMIHDVDFRVGIQSTPSKYADFRTKQLEYITSRLDSLGSNQSILSGDFNYRTCVRSFLRKLYPDCEIDTNPKADKVLIVSPLQNGTSGDDSTQKEIASITSKGLHSDIELIDPKHKSVLSSSNIEDSFKDMGYLELPLSFAPTYSFSEEEGSLDYISRRAPSWCDRILVRGRVNQFFLRDKKLAKYDSFGFESSIGDHKPVYLTFPLSFL